MSATSNILAKLPTLMKQILLHDEVVETNEAIISEHQLNDHQAVAMIGVIRKIILQTITPSGLVDALVKDLGLELEKAKALALDLLGRRFIPMEWYIGGVSEEIRKLGGDPIRFEAEAKKIYPEVYQPTTVDEVPTSLTPAEWSSRLPNPYNDDGSERQLSTEQSLLATDQESNPATHTEPTILHQLDERLTTTKGRAEILLRLTAVSQQIESAMHSGGLTETKGQDLLHTLDALSYAVNTKDLNPLEINAIKRRLKSVLGQLPS